MKIQVEQQSRLKQRLVGAIVLVALGVIFIPMILNGEREPGFIVNGSTIPARPAEIENIRQLEFATDDPALASTQQSRSGDIRIPVDERSAPLSTSKQDTAPASKIKPSKAISRPAEQPAAKKKQTASMTPTTYAWAVQVGSFQQKNNALKLRDRLRKEKYKAFVEGMRSNNTLIYRVRLGPYVTRGGAEQVREKLLAKQKMKGLVVKHP